MEFISYEEALKTVGDNGFEKSVISVDLDKANGQFLAEDLVADRDFPPFDRVTMDGVAIQFDKFQNGERKFKVEGIAAAGAPQAALVDSLSCLEVMTGAMLPKNTDTVFRYEDISIDDGYATIDDVEAKARQNVHFKGIDRKQGEIIVSKGRFLAAPELNIAASVGKTKIEVVQLPKAAIISTGNELVKVENKPEPHQIRQSNSHGISAVLADWGIESELFHLDDNEKEIEDSLSEIFKTFKMIVITGGVSKGKFDYLPKILEKLGVQKLFHKIRQRPGKPFWFGKADDVVVFALPGNPVSSFMCAQVYIRHWIASSLGIQVNFITGVLSKPVTFNRDLTYILECKSRVSGDGIFVLDPILGHGSGDFANLVDADGFVILPSDRNLFEQGEKHPFIPYRTKI